MDSTKEIEGKTIAIVGSSRNLEGKELGWYIDSFDYVVKFNGALFLRDKDDYCKDYGYKDDIHFLTNPFIREMEPDLDHLKEKPHFLFKKQYPQYRYIEYTTIKNSFKEVENQMQKGFAYSGVAVLNHLVKQKPKKIQVLGMDLYVDQPNYYDGDWSNYPEGYVPEGMKKFTDKEHSDGGLAHSRYWNAVVLNKLFLQNQNITFNKELMDNIQHIIQHRKEYE